MLDMSIITRPFFLLALIVVMSVPQLSLANARVVDENPSALAMVGDLVIARPVGLAATVIGTAVFLVTLPFSLLGGNAAEAGSTLVVGPAKTTFVRCLGCTQSGYQQDYSNEDDTVAAEE